MTESKLGNLKTAREFYAKSKSISLLKRKCVSQLLIRLSSLHTLFEALQNNKQIRLISYFFIFSILIIQVYAAVYSNDKTTFEVPQYFQILCGEVLL